MKYLSKKIREEDPDLEDRFSRYLQLNFSWDKILGKIHGPYISRRVQTLKHSKTSYWMLYLHFEDYMWYVQEHNLIKFIVTGSWSNEADHIDHNGLSNIEQNLRFVSRAINSGNRGADRDSISGYPNVYPHRNKWQVRLRFRVNRRLIAISYGEFFDFCEACQKSHDVRVSLGRYAPPVPRRSR